MSVIPIMPPPGYGSSRSSPGRSSSVRSSQFTPDSSPELGIPSHSQKKKRAPLIKSSTYSHASSRPDTLQYLPATTYTPPSPRGRFVSQAYVRPSLRLDHHMMPSPDEIMAAASATRGRRSGSTSSTSSTDTVNSTRSEKRQGRLFMPTSGGLLDLLMENPQLEE